MSFQCSPAIKNPVELLAYQPWSLAIEPFQVSPRTWYVAGQTWVGCYLIDTGDGLILIDTAIPESLYFWQRFIFADYSLPFNIHVKFIVKTDFFLYNCDESKRYHIFAVVF